MSLELKDIELENIENDLCHLRRDLEDVLDRVGRLKRIAETTGRKG